MTASIIRSAYGATGGLSSRADMTATTDHHTVTATAAARISVHAKWALLAGVLLYAVWATYVTWPLMEFRGDSVLGGVGDQTGGIAHMREWIQDGVFPFAPGTIHDFSAPEGLEVGWGVNLSGWAWTLPTWLLALVVGPFAAFALTTWGGIVLSGVVMQVLATRITASRVAGIVAGFAFAFYPYAIMKAATHPTFAHGWPLALLAWRMLEVAERPSRRNTVLAAGAAVVAIGFTPYYIVIGGVLLATCVVLALFRAWRLGSLRPQVRAQAVVCAAALVYLVLLAGSTLVGAQEGSGGGLRAHPTEELVAYAARAHEYVVPFGRNLVLGDTTAPYLGSRQHGSNFSETTLYLGLVVLLLALVGVVASLRRRPDPRIRRAALAGFVVALVGFVWSAPPEVTFGFISVPTPSKFVGELTTTWRVYSRFVVDVMLGVSVMAAAGVAALVRSRRPWVGLAIGCVAVAAIAVDFTWRPGVTQVETPPVYDLLQERPGGIVADYPLLPSGYGDSAGLLYQQAHGHPLLEGYSESGFDDRRASTLYWLNSPVTSRGLASLGVRYVMRPDDPAAFAGTPDPGRPGDGYSFVGSAPYGGTTASVYRVTARPDPGYAYVRVGAGGWEGDRSDPFMWISSPSGEVTVDAPQCADPCRGHLRMRLLSFGPERRVSLREVGGEQLWQGTVGATASRVDVPLTVDGRARITLTTDPGPIPAHEVDPSNPDMRPLSVAVSKLRFTS